MIHTDDEKRAYRTALEALRSGVPNSKAVEILGGNQAEAEKRFQHLLDTNSNTYYETKSMLVSGDFGTGKSHTLEYFKHLALSENYVCSMFSVSKETPFYNLDKTFQSAIYNGVIRDTVGLMVDEVVQNIDFNSDGYEAFFEWVHSGDSGLHKIFPATLIIHQKTNDADLINEIQSFWSGNKITQKTVKDGLKTIGEQHNYQFSAPKARDLPAQRLRFVLELIKAAGYKGWVILIDELELMGSYSILQRAKSYAELARWMGLDADEKYPGMVVVGAITEDFQSSIIYEKDDANNAVPRLQARGDECAAAMAKAGIACISQREQLGTISPQSVQASIAKIREIYSAAYDWQAPPFAEDNMLRAGHQNRMRYKVRAAINSWDLQRLYPGCEPHIKSTEHKPDYAEDTDFSSEVSADTDG